MHTFIALNILLLYSNKWNTSDHLQCVLRKEMYLVDGRERTTFVDSFQCDGKLRVPYSSVWLMASTIARLTNSVVNWGRLYYAIPSCSVHLDVSEDMCLGESTLLPGIAPECCSSLARHCASRFQAILILVAQWVSWAHMKFLQRCQFTFYFVLLSLSLITHTYIHTHSLTHTHLPSPGSSCPPCCTYLCHH